MATTIRVGIDQPDLDSALRYVEGLPGWEQSTQGSGGITTTKNTDHILVSGGNFSQAAPGDFIEIVGAHRNTSNPNGIYNATKPFLALINGTATEARLVSGVSKNVANASWFIHRPNSVTIWLPAGTHALPANTYRVIPSGVSLTLVGSPGAKINGNSTYQYIRYSQLSSVSIQNLEFDEVFEFIAPYVTDTEWSNGYRSDGIVSLINITINNPQGTSFANPRGSRIYMNNIKGNNALLNDIQCDDLVIANCFLRTASYGVAFNVTQPDASRTTKGATITDCYLEATGADCLRLGNSMEFLKEYQFTNCYIGAQVTQGYKALDLYYGKYQFTNCVIDGSIDLHNYPSIVTLVNTSQSDGGPAQLSNAGGNNTYITIV